MDGLEIENKDFEIPPPKPYVALCSQVNSLGWQGGGKFRPGRKVGFVFTLNARDSQGEYFRVSTELGLASGKKANLPKFLATWLGKAPASVKECLGKPATVFVGERKTPDGKVFATVTTVTQPISDDWQNMEVVGSIYNPDPANPGANDDLDALFPWHKFLVGRQIPEAEAKAQVKAFEDAEKAKKAAGANANALATANVQV